MGLPNIDIGFWGVIAAAAASFILGWIWHGVLFGKQWMKEMGFSKSKAKEIHGEKATRKMVLYFVGTVITAYVLAYLIKLGTVTTVFGGVKLALMIWIGFFAVTVLLGGVLWEGKSWKLYAINSGFWVVNLIVMSIALVYWG
jgi:hypothetical protein